MHLGHCGIALSGASEAIEDPWQPRFFLGHFSLSGRSFGQAVLKPFHLHASIGAHQMGGLCPNSSSNAKFPEPEIYLTPNYGNSPKSRSMF
jgi:hypothetical protein